MRDFAHLNVYLVIWSLKTICSQDALTDFDRKYVKRSGPRNDVPFGGRNTKI